MTFRMVSPIDVNWYAVLAAAASNMVLGALWYGPLLGKAFCVTGVLTRKREEVHALLRAAGATVHDSVKKDTSYLVAGDKTGKTKLDQAKKHGARVLTEDEMNVLLEGGSLPS